MKFILTGINLNYENGYNEEYTSVNLNFTTLGETFRISDHVVVSKEQYEEAGLSNVNLISLIKQEVIKQVQAADVHPES